MKIFQQIFNLILNQCVKSNNRYNSQVTLCTLNSSLMDLKIFHPLGAAECTHLLRYQGLAVENYSGAPECLANERIRRVKSSG